MAFCRQRPSSPGEDPDGAHRGEEGGFEVDQCPPVLLNLALALQHVLVQCSLLVLVVEMLQQGDREQLLASLLFTSGVSTLLQSCVGTCLPLIQAPSLDFMIPSMVLLSTSTDVHVSGEGVVCRGQCREKDLSVDQTHLLRELQGMTVTAGLLQVCVGVSGLGGAALRRSGPLVLAPVLGVLGFSCYQEAALLCSDHWGFAALSAFLVVFLSRHLRSAGPARFLSASAYPVCSMLSLLLSVLGVWGVCASLRLSGHLRPHTLRDLLNGSLTHWPAPPSQASPAPWLGLPLSGVGVPLLSPRATAAGVATALSCTVTSPAVYCLASRLLGAPPPPAEACNRGLCAEGLGSLTSALLGSPVGVSSSVPNACTIGLSGCGSRRTVQLAAGLSLVLGLSPRMTQVLTSTPLAINGAVFTVTYSVAVATGVSYFQCSHMDSGRNIFNIGFTVFMALVLPRWFRLNPTSTPTDASFAAVFLQSLLTLPVLLVGLMAFVLENTVSGSLAERGLERADDGRNCAVYQPPELVTRVLSSPCLRAVPFCACRTSDTQEVVTSSQEMATLLQ